MSMTGLPYAIRLTGCGCGRPKTPLRAAIWRASWRRGGSDVTRFEPGDEVFGVKLRLAKVTHSGVVSRVARRWRERWRTAGIEAAARLVLVWPGGRDLRFALHRGSPDPDGVSGL
jgi:hypothetical protein